MDDLLTCRDGPIVGVAAFSQYEKNVRFADGFYGIDRRASTGLGGGHATFSGAPVAKTHL